jgi:transcriptional regulator with XRE-family HTH domain
MAAKIDPEATARAEALRRRIAAKGLTIAEFGRQVGFTRNTTYGVLKGRKLRPPEVERVNAILGPEA